MLPIDPLWYKDAIIYELHVRAFHDDLGNGRGDFRGLTLKLDYLQDLGVTAIWLLPFYPSPLKDDGYDIADYTSIHPDYGTLDDFRVFLDEAHRRGLRVITELVLNHTSDQHAWFQRARRSPSGSPERDFYVWSDTPDRYTDARIIFKDFESSNWAWDPVARAYYWHRFYSHQPDLNFRNPEVWKAIFPVVDFWLEMGVDGLRLDAVPYLYECEGTNCENLPETHDFLRALRRHVDTKFRDRMLLAEANQWPEDAIAYFGQGDECHMAFHFPVMPRLFMAIHQEDRFPVLDILTQTPPIPDTCQWAMFLRNHDELTLEMVTDEERDYMYRAYASEPQARVNLGIRRRLAPLLGNDRRRIELMNALLFSLPGTPVIYYGDEIGMGDNIYLGDRNGVRTPMQWSADRNAGFSRCNPQKLYLPVIIDPEYHYEASNVEARQNNPLSLLWWMKRLMALRKQYRAFGRGSLHFLNPDNPKILAFIRKYPPSSTLAPEGNAGEEQILVVANLSRFVQYAELHLPEHHGCVPVELFGQIEFPTIGKHPFFLTLGPHTFYWFCLVPPRPVEVNGPALGQDARLPVLAAPAGLEGLLHGRGRKALEEILPAFLQTRSWFAHGPRGIKAARIWEVIPVPHDEPLGYLVLLRVEYLHATPETYVLPLAVAWGEQASDVRERQGRGIVARLQGETEGVLFDAIWEPRFAAALLDAIAAGTVLPGSAGELRPGLVPSRGAAPPAAGDHETTFPVGEPGHTSIACKDRLILKLFRRVEEGVNPDLEIRRFLTEKRGFAQVPPVVGWMEYRRPRSQPMTLALQQAYVGHETTAWHYTRDALGRYFERALARPDQPASPGRGAAALLALAEQDLPELVRETMNAFPEAARLLGLRTGELHAALAADLDDPNFAPEPFSMLYQRSIYQSMRGLCGSVLTRLGKGLKTLAEPDRDRAQRVLDRKADLLARFRAVTDHKIAALRIRCHGDYHLAQVLYVGKDFILSDFEGDPGRPLSERRLKRSPLRDVAGMVRSFHYAVCSVLGNVGAGGPPLGVSRGERLHAEKAPEAAGSLPQVALRPADITTLEPWGQFWYMWVAASFLKAYFAAVAPAQLFPADTANLTTLFEAFLLERAIYEVGYELDHRPAMIGVPLLGLLDMLEC